MPTSIPIAASGTTFTSLYNLNKEKVRAVIPAISVLSILMVIGLIGNILVVFVFGFKMKKASTYRLLILVLAMYDLMACVAGMPGLVVELEKPYMFYSGIGCKLLRFCYHVIAFGTSCTHVLVGIDRYRRVCKATSNQISVQSAKVISLLVFVIVFMVSIPVFLMNGSVSVQTRVKNITGNECDIIKQYSDTPFPLLFDSLLSLIVIASVIVLLVLYALIGRKICQRAEFFKSLSNDMVKNYNTAIRNKAERSRFNNKVEPTAHTSREYSHQQANANRVDIELESVSGVNSVMNRSHVKEIQHSVQPRQKQSKMLLSRKMTVTTFIMMIVYVVSYFPIMVLVMLEFSINNFKNNMTFTEEVFFNLGLHTYAINNVANPLIYIFMDLEFRTHCFRLISALKCK